MTHLLAVAGLPFLSHCTCFTTLNTSHVPEGSLNSEPQTQKTHGCSCTSAHLQVNVAEGRATLKWSMNDGRE